MGAVARALAAAENDEEEIVPVAQRCMLARHIALLEHAQRLNILTPEQERDLLAYRTLLLRWQQREASR